MTEAQTFSWIFYAVAQASQSDSVSYSGIESVADGINHAVPTQKEMQISLAWAVAQNLIQKEGKRFRLTEEGKRLFDDVSVGTMMNTWKNLEGRFGLLGAADNAELNPQTMST